ncbi:hypothetical protein QLG07_05175 [Erwinia sp. V90_4]|uniref:hypothetical protein n=1 Tax=Erwinia sp. V90_4 TaxID=3044239 RepID=UPI00249EB83C|nr:hypothetical protein [Erwinia sp. V90_4]MDI3438837.1 hypothetical protein [Erwinia sp. V90_4]
MLHRGFTDARAFASRIRLSGLTLPGGIRADLPGKLNCLWRAGSGSQKAQNDLYRLQHALTRSG